jgi:hypothetical protein
VEAVAAVTAEAVEAAAAAGPEPGLDTSGGGSAVGLVVRKNFPGYGLFDGKVVEEHDGRCLVRWSDGTETAMAWAAVLSAAAMTAAAMPPPSPCQQGSRKRPGLPGEEQGGQSQKNPRRERIPFIDTLGNDGLAALLQRVCDKTMQMVEMCRVRLNLMPGSTLPRIAHVNQQSLQGALNPYSLMLGTAADCLFVGAHWPTDSALQYPLIFSDQINMTTRLLRVQLAPPVRPSRS